MCPYTTSFYFDTHRDKSTAILPIVYAGGFIPRIDASLFKALFPPRFNVARLSRYLFVGTKTFDEISLPQREGKSQQITSYKW